LPEKHFIPESDAPMAEARFGQPENIDDLLNQYGTYNIQPTNEQENAFPMLMQALPTQWRGMKIHREDMQVPSP